MDHRPLCTRARCELCAHACRPLAPHAAVLVAARDDAYVAVQSTEAVAARWPGAELWHAEGGHVSSFLLLNTLYLDAITLALQKLEAGPPPQLPAAGERAGALPESALPSERIRAPGSDRVPHVSWGG